MARYFYVLSKMVIFIVTTPFVVAANTLIVLGVLTAELFGQTYEVSLDKIDSTEYKDKDPEEADFQSQLDSLKETDKVTKPITVTLQFGRKPFRLTPGGNASYKALKIKGKTKGPIDLG